MSTTIFVRSPYLIPVTGLVGQQTKVEIRAYSSGGTLPTNPTKTLSKPIPSASILTVNYNISPYIRKYIEHISFSNVVAIGSMLSTEWAKVQVKTFINDVLEDTLTFDCVDGYGYRAEGYNFSKSAAYSMLTEGTYYVGETSAGALYFDTTDDGNDYDVEWRNIYTNALIDSDTFTDGKVKIPYVDPAAFAQGGNKLDIYLVGNPTPLYSYVFITECAGRYTPLVCDFVNKFGVWQQVIFSKASRTSIDTESMDYNLMSQDVDYNVLIGSTQRLNVNGKDSIKVNTGLVGENYAEVVRQLLLSETILIDNKPVVPRTKAKDLPNHETEKQINYELNFDYAYNLINTIGI